MGVIEKDLSLPIQVQGVPYTLSYDKATGQLVIEGVSPPPPSVGHTSMGGGEPDKKETKSSPSDTPPYVPKTAQTIKLMIERLLRANRVGVQYSHNHTSGKLDMRVRSLVRGMTGSKSIYKQKKKPSLGYNFLFLVDLSGSMIGDKMDLTNKVMQNILPALDIAGIGVGVLTFDDKLKWAKHWEDSTLDKLYADGTNNDYAALSYALDHGFADAPSADRRQNVLIMLSDGEPCKGTYNTITRNGSSKPINISVPASNSISSVIRAMVQTKSSRYGIKTYGIGILSSAEQIPRRTQLNSLNMLQPTIEKIIKEIL